MIDDRKLEITAELALIFSEASELDKRRDELQHRAEILMNKLEED